MYSLQLQTACLFLNEIKPASLLSAYQWPSCNNCSFDYQWKGVVFWLNMSLSSIWHDRWKYECGMRLRAENRPTLLPRHPMLLRVFIIWQTQVYCLTAVSLDLEWKHRVGVLTQKNQGFWVSLFMADFTWEKYFVNCLFIGVSPSETFRHVRFGMVGFLCKCGYLRLTANEISLLTRKSTLNIIK